ncbi:MAG TPA: N-acetylmuramoyl-L-alanine amidase [Mycobacteriales bacterium]|nr:N-acetylmuramoyl-L-alanine amidase [Mycobacteriales bacterium]
MSRTGTAAITAIALAVLAACAGTAAHPTAGRRSAGTANGALPTQAAGPAGAATPTARPVVVLDPGHNGGNATHPAQVTHQVPAGYGRRKDCNTVGATTPDGYPEHAFTFDVARRVRALLTGHGVDVRMTRPNDTGVGPCVNERANVGNRARAAAVVSIHGDGSLAGHGFHVIEADRPPVGPSVAAASHRLAEAVHDRYLTGSGFVPATYVGRNGYNRRADLAGLNLSTRPTILIECGNMRDPNDARRMESPAGRQRIATAIAAGIEDYLRRK